MSLSKGASFSRKSANTRDTIGLIRRRRWRTRNTIFEIE